MDDAVKIGRMTDGRPTSKEAHSRRPELVAKLGALSGVALFAMTVAALFAGASTLTTPDVAGDVAVQDWSERHDQLGLRLVLLEVAAFFGLVFAAELKVRIERWGAAREALLAFSGGLLLVGLLVAHGSVSAAVLVVDDLSDDPQVAKAFLLLDWSFGVGLSAALAAMVAGLSIAAFRLRTLPRWLTLLGVVVLSVFVLNAALWQTASMSILGLMWIPIAAIALAIKRR